MDHVAPLQRSFPWRTAAIAALAVAVLELMALLALAGVRFAPAAHETPPAAAAAQTHAAAATTPVVHAAKKPATHVVNFGPPRAKAHPPRPLSRLSVLVLNGNGITHAAANEAAALLRRGYRAATSADAPNHDYAHSLVLFAPGYAREGRRLGRELGVRIVGPLDGMTPSQLKGSQLVVILGDS